MAVVWFNSKNISTSVLNLVVKHSSLKEKVYSDLQGLECRQVMLAPPSPSSSPSFRLVTLPVCARICSCPRNAHLQQTNAGFQSSIYTLQFLSIVSVHSMTIWDKLKVEHPLKISPIASVQTCLTPDSEAWLERHHSFITIMKTDPFLITRYNSTPKTGILKICQHLFGNLHTLLVICQFRSNLSTASVYKVEITDVSIDGASLPSSPDNVRELFQTKSHL